MTNPNTNSLLSPPQAPIPTIQIQAPTSNPTVLNLANQNGSNQNPLSVATMDAQKKARLAGPSSKKVKFTKAEDAKLAMLVAEYSDNDWKTIAEHMAPRTARQCRERWTNYVNPSLSKDPWTPEEDLLLIEKHKEFGNHWKIIERYFNNRSKNNIKHRWASMKDNYANNGNSVSNSDPAVSISTSEPTSTPTNSTSASPFPVPSVSELSTNSPSSEQLQSSIAQNISNVRKANRKKPTNGNSLLATSNIVATLAAAKSNKSSSQVAIPQINKIPQPVVNVVLQKQAQNQFNSQPIEPSIADQSVPMMFNFQNQPSSMSFPVQMPFLDSGAGGMGRNGGYGMSTGIGGVSDFIGDVDVDVDTIREGDVSSYAALDPFQFFDRILDQHEVYVQSMDKTDFWSIPEENYF